MSNLFPYKFKILLLLLGLVLSSCNQFGSVDEIIYINDESLAAQSLSEQPWFTRVAFSVANPRITKDLKFSLVYEGGSYEMKNMLFSENLKMVSVELEPPMINPVPSQVQLNISYKKRLVHSQVFQMSSTFASIYPANFIAKSPELCSVDALQAYEDSVQARLYQQYRGYLSWDEIVAMTGFTTNITPVISSVDYGRAGSEYNLVDDQDNCIKSFTMSYLPLATDAFLAILQDSDTIVTVRSSQRFLPSSAPSGATCSKCSNPNPQRAKPWSVCPRCDLRALLAQAARNSQTIVAKTLRTVLNLPEHLTGEKLHVAIMDTGAVQVQAVSLLSVNLLDPSNPQDIADTVSCSLKQFDYHGADITGIVQTIAPKANITAFKVCDDTGCSEEAILSALLTLLTNPDYQDISLVNMSWGGSLDSPELAYILKRFASERPEVLFVAAAGNSGPSITEFYPASYGKSLDNVLAVGAAKLDVSGSWESASFNTSISDFSSDNFGILAPGVNIISNLTQNQLNGTSYATPVALALAALYQEMAGGELPANDLRQQLLQQYMPTVSGERITTF